MTIWYKSSWNVGVKIQTAVAENITLEPAVILVGCGALSGKVKNLIFSGESKG